MYEVEVLTSWRVMNGHNEIAVALDYPASWWDATGQSDAQIPPSPNLFIASGVVDAATLTALDGDGNYLVLTVEEMSSLSEVAE